MTLKLERRTCVLELGEEYAGAEVHCRLDVDLGMFFDFMSLDPSDAEGVRAAVKEFTQRVLIGWDIIEDGEALPATEDGMLRLPPALVYSIIGAWSRAVASVPLEPDAPSPNGATLAAASKPLEP